MTPITSLFTALSDPLELELLEEHQQRYERIKAWREMQSDPYFSEVSQRWRNAFESKSRPKSKKMIEK